MKTCKRCGITKPLEEFFRNKDREDGHLTICKTCIKEFELSPAGIERRLRYQRSDKGKEHSKQYRQAEERKPINRQYTKKYRETEKGKLAIKKYYDNAKAEHPDRYKARTALMHAIQKGKIIKPDTCENCGKQHYGIHGHHPSYLYEDHLKVIWLCPSCHKLVHQSTVISST